MRKGIIIVILVAVAGVALAHWYYSDRGRFTTEPVYTGLERSVVGNALRSARDPVAVLGFDPLFRYLGGQKFVLYGVADVEQHFFVETGAAGELASVYWIQYEGYLPGKPYSYDYSDSPLRMSLGGLEFYTDTDFVAFDPDRKRRRGTDGAMVRRFLAGHGLSLPHEFAYARLVHLTDESHKKELMIIFIDDLRRYGVTAAELQTDSGDPARRRQVEAAHLARIEQTLTIAPRTP